MSQLTVTLVQTTLAWESASANREHMATLVPETISSDLVVLPEMFTTGFSMASSRLAEPVDGPTTGWLRDFAASRSTTVCGSVITEDQGHYYNRLLWVSPDGTVRHYDKRHLFRMSDEQHHYAAGRHRVVWPLGDFRVLPQICYDLRFPVFSRNRDDYDIALYVANWPAARAHHWRSLLTARAIENQAYVVGVNRIGSDGNGISYCGDSEAIAFDGNRIATAGDQQQCLTVTLDLADLAAYRAQFPAWKDADPFALDP